LRKPIFAVTALPERVIRITIQTSGATSLMISVENSSADRCTVCSPPVSAGTLKTSRLPTIEAMISVAGNAATAV